MAVPAEKSQYTFADVLTWNDVERVEIIGGEVYLMSPPPIREHQRISGEIFAQIHAYLKGKQCEVYAAPFAVRPFEQDGDTPEDVDTMVEPDITVVCDPSKLDKHGCKGAPDMVVEILSPSSRRHDRLVKLGVYQRAGVKEYWIVDPDSKSVQVLTLTNGLLLPHEDYGREDLAKVNVLEDCVINLSEVFPK